MGKKLRPIIKLVIVLILFLFGFFNQELIVEKTKTLSEYSSENLDLSDEVKLGLIENSSLVGVNFCPKDDCEKDFLDVISLAQNEIKCALFELDSIELSNLLINKSNYGVEVSIVIDGDYEDEYGVNLLYQTKVNVYSDGDRSKFMHNKFCVIDDKVILTGSTNPTENGFNFNNNNLIVFESEYLAKNYENEFDQLSSGKFGSKKESSLEYNNITLNNFDEVYRISNYFCPKDDCAKEIVKVLNNSQKEIIFMTFVLTNNEIEDVLIEKDSQGIGVKGLIEKRSVNLQGSRINELSNFFEIYNDTNSKTMHHKVFIVDRKIVITGSMNPSGSGDKYNDENILIIENENLALNYLEEFKILVD